MYKHILIATDGSELASRGLDEGLKLSKALGAKVTVVTVTELWSPFEMSEAVHSGKKNPLAEYEEAAARSARRILDVAKEKARTAGVEIRTVHVPDTHPADGIVDTAKREGCDLIVMASHGRRGARRLLLGSQTAETLAHTTIPILVIR